jgi:hypothetical protein
MRNDRTTRIQGGGGDGPDGRRGVPPVAKRGGAKVVRGASAPSARRYAELVAARLRAAAFGCPSGLPFVRPVSPPGFQSGLRGIVGW